MAEIDLTKTMAELLQELPEVGEALTELGIDCAGCIASQVDTLPDVARMYDLKLEEILQRIEGIRRRMGR